MPMSNNPEMFSGSILSSEEAYASYLSDLNGNFKVFQVANENDVVLALSSIDSAREQLKWDAGDDAPEIPVFMKSGRQADFLTPTEDSEKFGAIIDTQYLKTVAVDGNTVFVGSGATNHQINSELASSGLILPLPHNNEQSIASSVLKSSCNPLVRTLGSPNVVSLTVVSSPSINSVPFGHYQEAVKKAVNNEPNISVESVVTGIKLRAYENSDLWMTSLTVQLPEESVVRDVASDLLSHSGWDGVDIGLRILPMYLNMPCLSIRIAGRSAEDIEKADEVMLAMAYKLGLSEEEFDDQVYWYRAGDVAAALMEYDQTSSMDKAMHPEKVMVHFSGDEADRELFITDTIKQYFTREGPEDRAGSRSSEITRDITLQLNVGESLCVVGYRYFDQVPDIEQGAFVKSNAEINAMGALDYYEPAMESSPIDGFTGHVITEAWGTKYETASWQYAVGSILNKSRTRPALICFPRNENDLMLAVNYAREKKYALIVRSGGHHFAGLSTGGSDVMVVAMDLFNAVELVADDETGVTLSAGPGASLSDLVKAFTKKGIALPHGECALVKVGGHIQTGGYGHMTRCFGYFQDYIQSFDIVLADGTPRHVERPEVDSEKRATQKRENDNDDLYWAALGGNPGSYGIIYKCTFKCIKDNDPQFAGSDRYIGVQKFSKGRYERVLKTFQAWSVAAKEGTLALNRDLFMTTISGTDPITYDIISINSTHSTAPDDILESLDPTSRDHLFEIMSENNSPVEKGCQIFDDERPNIASKFPSNKVECRKPSQLSRNSVRDFFIMPRGREFVMPFLKAAYATTEPLNDDFVKALVDLTDQVLNGRGRRQGLRLSTEMWVGGGSYEDPMKRDKNAYGAITKPDNWEYNSLTASPQRSQVLGFTFDLFYNGNCGRRDAEKFHRKLKRLVKRHNFFGNADEQRMFWGSFGEYPVDFDMTKERNQRRYYNRSSDRQQDDDFDKLCAIKAKHDPTNLFQTVMTVPLPLNE